MVYVSPMLAGGPGGHENRGGAAAGGLPPDEAANTTMAEAATNAGAGSRPFSVFSNCPKVELFLNGQSLGTKDKLSGGIRFLPCTANAPPMCARPPIPGSSPSPPMAEAWPVRKPLGGSCRTGGVGEPAGPRNLVCIVNLRLTGTKQRIWSHWFLQRAKTKPTIMQRNRKIASLPRPVRDELNQRLANNEEGGALLQWLNSAPGVGALLASDFAGEPIGLPDLEEWREGGFVRWQARQKLLDQARDLAVVAGELDAAAGGNLIDQLATALAGRYAAVAASWDGTDNEAIRAQLRILRQFAKDLEVLRRGSQSAARLKMAQAAFEREEKKFAEIVAFEQKWNPSGANPRNN